MSSGDCLVLEECAKLARTISPARFRNVAEVLFKLQVIREELEEDKEKKKRYPQKAF